MKWSDLIDNSNLNPFLTEINHTLSEYNHAYNKGKHSEDHLKKIISACDFYIESIPIYQRISPVILDENEWENKLAQYPKIIQVLNIQKNAVNRLFLPQATSDLNARFDLLRQLVDLAPLGANQPNGKMLEEGYWSEFKYRGKKFIAKWVTSNRNNKFLSYTELMPTINDNVNYDPCLEKYRVSFQKGLLYLKNQLLNTRYSTGSIYVSSRDGHLYVNNDEIIESDIHFFHSSFLSGKKIECGGEIKVKDGQIKEINIRSGHYKPKNKI